MALSGSLPQINLDVQELGWSNGENLRPSSVALKSGCWRCRRLQAVDGSAELSCFVPTDDLSCFSFLLHELSCSVPTAELSCFVPAAELSCFLLLSCFVHVGELSCFLLLI
ncbi:hypothetical protein TNCV_3152741 [Trichonephila clavipes]|nr:hypothetical protein TNCV_3152741 [Trichonephila clavipes]